MTRTQLKAAGGGGISLLAVVVAAAAAGGTLQCGDPRQGLGPEVVAHVDGRPVTLEDLRARVVQDSRAPTEARPRRGDRRRLLRRTIDDHLLLREARRRGIAITYGDLDPVRRRSVRRFLSAEFEGTVDPGDIPEEEVRAEYERFRASMGNPEMRRIEVAFVKTRASADALWRQAREKGDDTDAIQHVLRRGCEQPRGATSVRYGGFFPLEEAEHYMGEAVARAAFALPDEQPLCPEPVPFRGGWAVVAVTNRAPEKVIPYQSAAPQLRARLFGPHRDRALDRFVDGFRGEHDVVLREEHLDLVDWTGQQRVEAPPAGEVDSSHPAPSRP